MYILTIHRDEDLLVCCVKHLFAAAVNLSSHN